MNKSLPTRKKAPPKYRIDHKWCRYCNCVNALESVACMKCGKSNLVLLPSTPESSKKVYEMLSAYMEVANYAYSKLIVNGDMTEQSEKFISVALVNYVFAIELGMKQELLMYAIEYEKTHNIKDLYEQLHEDRKSDYEQKFKYMSERNDGYSLQTFLEEIDNLFVEIRYVHADTLSKGGKLSFYIEFFDDVRKFAEYCTKLPVVYCRAIYCRKPESECDCDNCEFIPRDAWQ